MKNVAIALTAVILGSSLACAPKKNGKHPMAPKAENLQKLAAKAAGCEYKESPENAVLEKAFKGGEVAVKAGEGGKSTVLVNLHFDADVKALPEGHDGEIQLESLPNSGTEGVDAKAKAKAGEAVSGAVVCDKGCAEVVACVKVSYQTKDKDGPKTVNRMALFGFDVQKNAVIWKSPGKKEEKK